MREFTKLASDNTKPARNIYYSVVLVAIGMILALVFCSTGALQEARARRSESNFYSTNKEYLYEIT